MLSHAERHKSPRTTKSPQAAVFLDRDGILNENRADYVKSQEEFVFLPGIFEPLAALARAHRLIVVTNQSAIARGLISPAELDAIHRHMTAQIRLWGGRIDAVLVCPHGPGDVCSCRKPRPGLLLNALSRFSVRADRSWVVGDAASDVEAALAAGVKPVLVLTGRGAAESASVHLSHPEVPVVNDLAAAAELIFRTEEAEAAECGSLVGLKS